MEKESKILVADLSAKHHFTMILFNKVIWICLIVFMVVCFYTLIFDRFNYFKGKDYLVKVNKVTGEYSRIHYEPEYSFTGTID
jgi:hypothetical protein